MLLWRTWPTAERELHWISRKFRPCDKTAENNPADEYTPSFIFMGLYGKSMRVGIQGIFGLKEGVNLLYLLLL